MLCQKEICLYVWYRLIVIIKVFMNGLNYNVCFCSKIQSRKFCVFGIILFPYTNTISYAASLSHQVWCERSLSLFPELILKAWVTAAFRSFCNTVHAVIGQCGISKDYAFQGCQEGSVFRNGSPDLPVNHGVTSVRHHQHFQV